MKRVVEVVVKWGGKSVDGAAPGDPLSYEFRTQKDALRASIELGDLGLITMKLDRVVALM